MSRRPPLARRLLDRLGRIAERLGMEGLVTELTYRVARRRRLELAQALERLPRALYLEATNICNARCVFCAYPQMERAKTSMSPELFNRVVTDYAAAGGRHVSLTPIVGDPTVDKHLFDRLDLLAGQSGIESFHFFTNAILLEPATIERLLTYGAPLRVAVSMGGFDREVYHRLMGVDRFEVVWRNLECFVAQKQATGSATELHLHVRCSTAERRGPAWRQVTEWRRRGLVEVATIDTYDSWAGAISSEVLESNGLPPRPMPHKRGACELLYMKPVVLADGRVNGCACRDAEAELVVGDLRKQSLSEVLEGPELAELRQRHHDGDYPDVCRRCTYYVSIFNPLKSRIGRGPSAQDELD